MREIWRFVDGDRLWERHEMLATFGGTARGGVDRPALSKPEIAARAELRKWGAAIGLEPSADDIGNLFLHLRGRLPELPPILVGSHIDSQPTGGRYDGVYGVLAALECIEAIVASGEMPQRSIELVCWTNEEGSRFAPGMMGSAAFAGRRRMQDILAVLDAEGITVAHALQIVQAAEAGLARRPLGGAVGGYVEAHIEQGPILEMHSIPIGIVTGIQGKRTFRVRVVGEESHAGTSPRSARKDALMDSVKTPLPIKRMSFALRLACSQSGRTLRRSSRQRSNSQSTFVIPMRVFWPSSVTRLRRSANATVPLAWSRHASSSMTRPSNSHLRSETSFARPPTELACNILISRRVPATTPAISTTSARRR
jgi:hypothetical protein